MDEAATEPYDDRTGTWVRVTSPDGGAIHAGYLVRCGGEHVVIETADGSHRVLPASFTVEQVEAPRNLVTPPAASPRPRRRPDGAVPVPAGTQDGSEAQNATGRKVVSEADLRTALEAARRITEVLGPVLDEAR